MKTELLSLWQEKQKTGYIRYDANLLAIHIIADDLIYDWGTVFYSQAREAYKTKVKHNNIKATFDLELMSMMYMADYGGLIIAANPNSLFKGHLVIYPQKKSPELCFQDLYDITHFAENQSEQTFILNMERSAASILDWAHFQAYPFSFPIEKEKKEIIKVFKKGQIARTSANSPAYALIIENFPTETLALLLFKILELLSKKENPHGQKIPCNIIWRANRAYIILRAMNQSDFVATYFGGLEMGGIFCLPNADNLRQYMPEVLRSQIIQATLTCEKETQNWFEDITLQLVNGII